MKFVFYCVIVSFSMSMGCTYQGAEEEYKRYFTKKDFNGLVLISRKGEIIYKGAFGYSDFEKKTATDPDDTYLIGSITKQFTSISILMLEAEGLLSTKDSLGKFFSRIPGNWPGTTIHELLSHSSGFPDFDDLPDFFISTPFSADDLIDKMAEKPVPFFDKGKFRYSSIGYVLLGKIVEKVSGLVYCEFIASHIFRPLQMNKTGCIENQDELTTRGYISSQDSSVRQVPFSYLTFSMGSGNLYSSIGDLSKWDEAIRSKKLFPESIYRKWISRYAEIQEQSEYEDKGDFIGYAWFLSFRGNKLFKTYHVGGVAGYKASITRFPNEEMLVLTLSNVENQYSNLIRLEFPRLVYQKEIEVRPKLMK